MSGCFLQWQQTKRYTGGVDSPEVTLLELRFFVLWFSGKKRWQAGFAAIIFGSCCEAHRAVKNVLSSCLQGMLSIRAGVRYTKVLVLPPHGQISFSVIQTHGSPHIYTWMNSFRWTHVIWRLAESSDFIQIELVHLK